jgi:hypothetical protein
VRLWNSQADRADRQRCHWDQSPFSHSPQHWWLRLSLGRRLRACEQTSRWRCTKILVHTKTQEDSLRTSGSAPSEPRRGTSSTTRVATRAEGDVPDADGADTKGRVGLSGSLACRNTRVSAGRPKPTPAPTPAPGGGVSGSLGRFGDDMLLAAARAATRSPRALMVCASLPIQRFWSVHRVSRQRQCHHLSATPKNERHQ